MSKLSGWPVGKRVLIGALTLLCASAAAPAARFPPAVAAHKYGADVEKVIRRVADASLREATPVELRYDVTIRLNDTRGSRIVRAYTFSRHGTCAAQGDRLDLRRCAVGGVTDCQWTRSGDAFLRYWPFEDEAVGVWPDSAEKDRRADEMDLSHVWLPVLANLYPNQYLRWADLYACRAPVTVDGQRYDIIEAVPDYALAARNRDLGKGSDYWGLRPRIRYYINPRTSRVECVERLFYTWEQSKSDSPTYLYRRCVSRIAAWKQQGKYWLPSKVIAQEINPREGAPYKELELVINAVTIGGRPTFESLAPDGRHHDEAELRALEYYAAQLRQPGRRQAARLGDTLLAAEAAFGMGEKEQGRSILEGVRSAGLVGVEDLRGYARACRASADDNLIRDAGGLLQASLDATASTSDGSLGLSRAERERRLADLHVAISENISRRTWIDEDGEAHHNRTTAAAYLADVLRKLHDPAARRVVLSRAVMEYARAGMTDRARSLVDEHVATCVDADAAGDFADGLRARIEYWQIRNDWWQSVINKMRQRERTHSPAQSSTRD